jgi:hypothetical protein
MHAGMKEPLGSIMIAQQETIRLFAEESFTRFHWNWHKACLSETLFVPAPNRTKVFQSLDWDIDFSQTISDSIPNLRDASIAPTHAGLWITRNSSVDRGVKAASVKPRIFASRSDGCTGLERRSKPYPFERAVSSKSAVDAWPENNSTLQSGQWNRTKIASSIPDKTGITTSEIRRSGASSRVASNASRGCVKDVASKPWERKIIAKVDAMTSSSSTTKTRGSLCIQVSLLESLEADQLFDGNQKVSTESLINLTS